MRLIERYRFAFLLFLALTEQAAPGLAQRQNATWVTGAPADAFWDKLARSPYTQNGSHGLVVYMLSYSQCGNCINFLRDFWEPHRAHMQLREIFVPISQPKLIDEAADMALTRKAARADAYYHRRLVAPPATGSPERKAALDQVVAFTTSANQFFVSLGHIQDSYPTFLFRVQEGGRDKLMIVSGYGPDFARDLDSWVAAAAQSDAARR